MLSATHFVRGTVLGSINIVTHFYYRSFEDYNKQHVTEGHFYVTNGQTFFTVDMIISISYNGL